MKSNVVEIVALCVAVVAAVVATRTRSERRKRKSKEFMLQTPVVSNGREMELVQDIVYINNSTSPDSFRLDRHNQTINDEGHQILVVGVCGGSGSGKTTLSRAIMAEFGAERVSYLSHDYYYKDLGHLTLEQRAEHNFDHPDSLETDLLVEHLRQLRAGRTVDIPVYDFATHSRCKETQRMKPNSVILVEGILIFADQALADLMDIKIFVETSADIRLVRRLRRDIEERDRSAESVMSQYMKTVRPMHMMFVEQSKRVADIIIPHGVNSVALDMIISKLHTFTSRQGSTPSSSRSHSERSDSAGDDKEAHGHVAGADVNAPSA